MILFMHLIMCFKCLIILLIIYFILCFILFYIIGFIILFKLVFFCLNDFFFFFHLVQGCFFICKFFISFIQCYPLMILFMSLIMCFKCLIILLIIYFNRCFKIVYILL